MVWNINFIFPYFPIYWECHHPNWLSYFSEGWLKTTHQILFGQPIDWPDPARWGFLLIIPAVVSKQRGAIACLVAVGSGPRESKRTRGPSWRTLTFGHSCDTSSNSILALDTIWYFELFWYIVKICWTHIDWLVVIPISYIAYLWYRSYFIKCNLMCVELDGIAALNQTCKTREL